MNIRINKENEEIVEKLKGTHSKTYNAVLSFLDYTKANPQDFILLLDKIDIILRKEHILFSEFVKVIDSKPMQKGRLGVMVESLLKLELGGKNED